MGRPIGRAYVIGGTFREGWKNCNNLPREVQTDAHLTESVIARMMPFVAHEYPTWSGALTRESLGVDIRRSTREIDSRDIAHCIRRPVGNMYLRSHSGQTYMYENGAFRLLNGVTPESLFQRRKEYAAYVEGRICRPGKIPPRTVDGRRGPFRRNRSSFSAHYVAKGL